MAYIHNELESIFPQFEVITVLRANKYKKTVKVKRSGYFYILKLFNLTGVRKEHIDQVINLLNKLTLKKNKHLLKFYEASHDEALTYLGYSYILLRVVSEYIQSTKLSTNEDDIWKSFRDLIDGLNLFHPKKSHGKISVQNIFHNPQGESILGEMNIAQMLNRHYQDLNLLAPEFIKAGVYDFKSDIWMLGYWLYQVMFGEPPHIATNLGVLHKKILKGINLMYHPGYDPEIRPNCDQINQLIDMHGTSSMSLIKVMPKYKVDRITLHKLKEEKIPEEVHNFIELNDDLYRKPLFPPSKVRKSNQKSPNNRQKVFFEQLPIQKATWTLPKVVPFQYMHQSVRRNTKNESSLQELQETQRLLEEQPATKYIEMPRRQTDQLWHKSPQRILFEQQLLNITKNKSTKQIV